MRLVSLLLVLTVCFSTPTLEARRRCAPHCGVCYPTHGHQTAIYSLDLPKLERGEINYINGMHHHPRRAVRCAEILSSMARNQNIYTVYNPTHGRFNDLRKCMIELFRFEITPPVNKLQEKWDCFFETASPDEKYLQFCHSQGAIQVRNALLHYPKERRERIIVVAIAPGGYIPDQLCHKAYHYVSRRDIVPHFDRKGKKQCQGSTVMLTPHRQARFFDHHFTSPTYRNAIYFHLLDYLDSEQMADKLYTYCLEQAPAEQK